jgi:ubiquinone/menaquinone biosynthesis C-methylase UbiE
VTDHIRFDDAAGYEQYMGRWSQLVSEVFLDWVGVRPGLRWLDVGCGTGAFVRMLVERYAPASVHGIDPSEAQLAFARTHVVSPLVEFRQADAVALPFPDRSFDAAVMALVIFFIPDPAKAVAEMARVVARGGLVASYAWDMPGGGFPSHALQVEMRAMGLRVPQAPSADASGAEALRALWTAAGLESVEGHAITVEQTFADMDEYWATLLSAPSVGATLRALTPEDTAMLKDRVRARLATDPDGRILCSARANAVKGRAT